MPNTRNLPFIQANGMMNFLASAIFEKNFEAVKELQHHKTLRSTNTFIER